MRKPMVIGSRGAVLAILLGVAPARAGWIPNGAPIIVAPCAESPTAAVSDARGGMYVFWTDNRSCAHDDVFVQRIDGLGSIATGWPDGGMPVCPPGSGQGSALAIPTGNKEAIVVWTDGRSGVQQLYGQRIGPDGGRRWSPEGIRLCDAPSGQGGFGMLADGAGGVFAAWMDGRRGLVDDTPRHHPLFDLYAQHLDAQGARTWPAMGLAVCTNANVQDTPQLVSDGGSGVLVTWLDRRGPADLQHLDASGTAHLAADGVAIPGRFLGLVAPDGAGGMISAFKYGPDTQQDLYAQRVDSNGALVWPMNGVLVAGAAFDQRPSDIVSDGSGGAFIAWHDLRNGTDWDVYVQRITTSGAAAAGWPVNGLATCTAPGFQVYPRLTPDLAGGCVLAWYDARDAATAYDIYAQRITGQGAVADGWPANGAALCVASGDQTLPLPVPDGSGGALVAWSDYRVYADVYAQHVSGSGGVGEPGAVVSVGTPGPSPLALGPVFPNPLTGRTLTVTLSLPDAAPAELSLTDLQGRRLARASVPAGALGSIAIRFKTPDGLSPGVYLIRLGQAGRVVSRRLSILR